MQYPTSLLFAMCKRLNIIAIIATLAFVCTGCATMFSDVNYPVMIESNPSSMLIHVLDDEGKLIHQGTTPTSVTLSSSQGYMKGASYTINLMRDGKVIGTNSMRSEIDGWYWANLVLGGLLGMLVVDPLTGKMWSLDTEVFVSETYASISPNELHILDVNEIPENQREYLIALN